MPLIRIEERIPNGTEIYEILPAQIVDRFYHRPTSSGIERVDAKYHNNVRAGMVLLIGLTGMMGFLRSGK